MASNATANCPVDLAARIPEQYSDTSYNAASCTAASFCGPNADSIARCCTAASAGGDPSTTTFDTDDGEYVTCTLPESQWSNTTAYADYQSCLFASGVFPFQCNTMNQATQPMCNETFPPPPPEGEESDSVYNCGLNNSPNASAAFAACCPDGSASVVAFRSGCQAYCTGNETLESCLNQQLGLPNGSSSVGCSFRPRQPSGGNDTGGASSMHMLGWIPLAVLGLALTALMQ